MRIKKKTKNVVGLGAILIIIILVIIGVIIFLEENTNKILIDEKGTLVSTISNSVHNQSNVDKESIKLDQDKDLVYDASYLVETDKDLSYQSVVDGKIYNIKDIIVPYININSEDALNVNNEIKVKYNEVINKFKEEASGDRIVYDLLIYKTYINNDVLSIVLNEKIGGTDLEKDFYYTYNFNLKTLKQITYNDLYKGVGYTDNNIDDKVKKCIAANDEYVAFSKSGEDVSQYVLDSINEYENSVQNNTIKSYLNKVGNLNIIVNLKIPAGTGEISKIIEIK